MKIYSLNIYSLALLLIFTFALFIRVYGLGEIPYGIYCDEALNGYHSYSILKTGKDAFGRYLPSLFKAHNVGFVEPIYIYLSVPIVALFDLSIFSTRLLSALVGAFTVLTTYLFIKELLNRHIAIIAALLIAISPWHFTFSRIGFRAIFVPLLLTLALYFFLKSFKNPRWIIVSAFVFGLTFYSYTVMKFATPVLILVLTLVFFREISGLQSLNLNRLSDLIKISKNRLWTSIVSIILVAILAMPAYITWFDVEKNNRFNSMSIFNNPQPEKLFASNMLKHISFDFLFVAGDSNLRHSIANFGQVLPILIPFILLSIFYFYFYKKKKKGLFLLLLFLIGIMPPSLMYWSNPHALRSIAAVPVFEIFAACGMYIAVKFLIKRRGIIKIPILSIIAIAVTMNSVLFFHSYFFKYPVYSGAWFQAGTKEAIEYAEEHYDNYDNIVLTPKLDQFYIFPLFFRKQDPSEYHKTGKIGKYIICKRDINNCFDENANNLYIATINELRDKKLEVKQEIYSKSGYLVFKILD